jgi:hypothetical protein
MVDVLSVDAEHFEELLDVDREYREKAAAGQLRSIAPRRFNPSGEAWLPVLHTQRRERHYTKSPLPSALRCPCFDFAGATLSTNGWSCHPLSLPFALSVAASAAESKGGQSQGEWLV